MKFLATPLFLTSEPAKVRLVMLADRQQIKPTEFEPCRFSRSKDDDLSIIYEDKTEHMQCCKIAELGELGRFVWCCSAATAFRTQQ